jgi:hypothetical protein
MVLATQYTQQRRMAPNMPLKRTGLVMSLINAGELTAEGKRMHYLLGQRIYE